MAQPLTQPLTTRRVRPQKRRQKIRSPWASIGIYVVLVAVALVFVVPLLWPILRSFEPNLLVTGAPSTEDFTHLTVGNYQALFGGNVKILGNVLNSMLVTLGSVVLTGVLSTLGGYGFGKFHFRGQSVLFITILSTLMLPFQAIITPLFLELHILHLTNSLYGLILVYTTFNLPLGLFVMRNSFREIPREIEESARVDGASTRRLLLRVMLPLVLPGMITVCIFTFLFSWTEFLAALTLLTSNHLFTLPISLLSIETGTFGQVDYAVLEAGAVIAMIPSIGVYLALQRYYIAGFMSGSVKG
jgi:multiple sugar transport system permease protein